MTKSPDRKAELQASFPDLATLPDICAQGVSALHRNPPIDAVQWMDENFELVQESSGIAGPWKTYPYQKAIIHIFADDQIKFVAVQKSTRMGYTKILTGNKIRNATYLKRNVLGYQPTDDDAVGYDKDELTPAIYANPELAKYLVSDTAARKGFENAVIHNLGGESSNNYRRRTGDLVDADEIDELPLNVGRKKEQKQGSAIRLMARAITDSPFGKQIVGGSPTTENFSLIAKQLDKLKHVLHRWFPCPHCGWFQTLKFGTSDDKDRFGLKWVGNDFETAKYCCESCHALIDYEQMTQEMDPNAEWRTRDMVVDDDSGEFFGLLDENGEVLPRSKRRPVKPPRRIGIKMNSLYSHFVPWSELVEIFLEAAALSRTGDNGDLITFTNHYLGDTWKEKVYDIVEPIEFKADHTLKYAAQVPEPVVVITAGVDIQKDHIHVEFCGYAPEEVSYGISYQRIYGDLDDYETWGRLETMLDQEFKHESGQLMQAKLVGIDSGHRAQDVYRFCKRQAIRFIPMKGAPAGPHQIIHKFPRKRNADGVFLTLVGGDAILDILRRRYLKKREEKVPPGFCFWPDSDGYDNDYFKGLLADGKVKKGTNWSWEPPTGVSNDESDCRKYGFAALRILVDAFKFPLMVAKEKQEKANEKQEDVYAQIRDLAKSINNG